MMSNPDLRKTADGTRLSVEKKLGEGSQGEVWRAMDGGAPVAVKVYHPHSASEEQRKSLERLVERPSPAPQFLWPSAMIDSIASGTYGYVMPLREGRFRPFEDYMARRIKPSLRTLLAAGAQLAHGFQRLHAEGLCYRDISFANIFLDPRTGDVSVCDNDNVDLSGAAPGGVLGTPRFMAPEVVRGEAPPSADTDRYSLAVLLFYLLYGGHPLDGRREAQIRCMDAPAMQQLYGVRPLYIWDANDDSNRPVLGLHDNPLAFENIWPEPLPRLFLNSFTQGLHYPRKRIRESEWRKVLLRTMDNICRCGCGVENFHDAASPPGGRERSCWNCNLKLTLPPRIEFEDGNVLLTPDTRLFGRHVGSDEPDDAVAEIAPHPQRRDLFGLKNLSGEAWSLTAPGGSTVEVPPGKSAPIMAGNRINFGRRTGTVRAQ